MDIEMLENHRALVEVLVGLFEGFEEDPEALQKLAEEFNAQQKQNSSKNSLYF